MLISDALNSYKNRVEEKLKSYLPIHSKETLQKAMVYSTFNGGKRIRPVLIYLIGTTLKAPLSSLDIPACAIEILHSSSLVHDDLPAIDNDDLRRGKPTCHKAFGEASAIFTGDALLVLSFNVLSQKTVFLNSEQQNKMVHILAQKSGFLGMLGGQSLDIQNDASLTIEKLTEIHRLKTGTLLNACAQMACVTANCNDEKIILALDSYANYIGLNFQIRDDIIGMESSTKTLGKTAKSDDAKNKITFPKLLGMKRAKEKCIELHHLAVAQLKIIGMEKSLLADLSDYIIHRDF